MSATTAYTRSRTVVAGTSVTAPRREGEGVRVSPGGTATYATRPRPARSSSTPMSTISSAAAESSTPVRCSSHQPRSRRAAPGSANSSPYIGGTSTGMFPPAVAASDRIPTATASASSGSLTSTRQA
ncbi:hypothetical protein [Streptomyces armeniacus]|uniref:hypothetical protein n=1 Tax=Streptomyces armeniacus TaxID=83291 RepID=UPI001AD823E5|nr:hypothetical protein [Streptomyces armeniacus]